MSLRAERTLQQVKMSDELHSTLKFYAKSQGFFLNEVIDRAIEELLQSRSILRIEYLASPMNGKARSLWIHHTMDARAKKAAELDQVPLNRLIYTAMDRFSRVHAMPQLSIPPRS